MNAPTVAYKQLKANKQFLNVRMIVKCCYHENKFQPTIFPLSKHVIRFHEFPDETMQRILQ